MKQILIAFLIILLSIFWSVGLLKDSGYMLVLFHGWQMETTVVVFVVLLLLSLIITALIIHLMTCILRFPAHIQKTFFKWRQHREKISLDQAIEAFYQEKWDLSLKKIQAHEKHLPWMTDLIAAKAAQAQNKLDVRDHFLHLASVNEPKATDTILLFQAKLQLEKNQLEEAEASLKQIARHSKKLVNHWYWLQLKLYLKRGNYKEGLELLENNKSLEKETSLFQFNYPIVAIAYLHELLKKKDYARAYQLYKKRPKFLKDGIDLLLVIAEELSKLNDYSSTIKKDIYQALNLHPDNGALLVLITKLPFDAKYQKLIEKKVLEHPNNHQIYWCLGQLKASQKLWGAAIYDLQKSIECQPTARVWSSLAKVYLDLKQTSNALEAMHKALTFEEKI